MQISEIHEELGALNMSIDFIFYWKKSQYIGPTRGQLGQTDNRRRRSENNDK